MNNQHDIIEKLIGLFHETYGIYFSPDKRDEIYNKLLNLANEQRVDLYELYNAVTTDSPIQSKLLDIFTIGETYFFRNKPHFNALEKNVLPSIIARNESHKSLNIWSAGCATGEEPYSLAIFLAEKFPQLRDWDINIIGTDISATSLKKAKQHFYGTWSFRNVEPFIIEKYFQKVDKKTYKLSDAIAKQVEFIPHNLAQFPYPFQFSSSIFDLVLCRNVLIYFSMGKIDKIIEAFHNSVRDGGYLFIGHSEAFSSLKIFENNYYEGTFFYRKSQKNTFKGFSKNIVPFGLNELRDIRLSVPEIQIDNNITAKSDIENKTEPQREETLQNLYEKAKTLANEGDFEKALVILDEILQYDSGDSKAHMLKAVIAEHQHHYEDAIRHLKSVIFLNKKHFVAHYSLGMIYDRLGQGDSAKRSYINAQKLLNENSVFHKDEELDIMGGIGRLKEILTSRIVELNPTRASENNG